MKKRAMNRKLSLNRETLIHLETENLNQVAGGQLLTILSCIFSCKTHCTCPGQTCQTC